MSFAGSSHRLTFATVPKWVQQGHFRIKKFDRLTGLVEDFDENKEQPSNKRQKAHLFRKNGKDEIDLQKEVAAQTMKDKRTAIEKIKELLKDDISQPKSIEQLKSRHRFIEPKMTSHEHHRKHVNLHPKEKRGRQRSTTTTTRKTKTTTTTTRRPKKKDNSHGTSTTTPIPDIIPTVRGKVFVLQFIYLELII